MPRIDINSPDILTYVRYEPISVSRNLSATVNASVHDALWMLTQQIRVGEFKGDDAGSISKARIVSQSVKLNRFKGRNNDSAQAFEEEIPLEARVERLPLNDDLGLQLELGNILLKLLRKQFPAEANAVLYELRKNYAIEGLSTVDAEKMSNNEAMRIRSLVTGRALDGVKLYRFLIDGGDLNEFTGSSPDLTNVAAKFMQWVETTYLVPGSPEENSWSDTQLEYQCAVSAPLTAAANAAEHVLQADKYTRGNLDWYSFDLHRNNNFKLSDNSDYVDNAAAILPETVQSYIPQTITFKGMPKARWWEFEDKNNDLSKMLTQKHDIVKMVVMEFGLIYSNDWFIIPHRVKDHTITEIESLVTMDVFGRQFLVKRAGEASSQQWHKWDMYNLTVHGANETDTFGKLLMIPSINNRMEGRPTEKVLFLRDEMANMVWGVEEVVPNELMSGMDGKNANNELQKYLQSVYPPQAGNGTVGNDASFRFRLSNAVPENWIPFIPKKVDPLQFNLREVMLQRATMRRYINGEYVDGEFIRPRTSILSVGLEDSNNSRPYFINEEEVSRSGFVVSTHFQRARWYDGKTYTWLGRKVLSGRGEGNSGLKFDILVDKDPN